MGTQQQRPPIEIIKVVKKEESWITARREAIRAQQKEKEVKKEETQKLIKTLAKKYGKAQIDELTKKLGL